MIALLSLSLVIPREWDDRVEKLAPFVSNTLFTRKHTLKQLLFPFWPVFIPVFPCLAWKPPQRGGRDAINDELAAGAGKIVKAGMEERKRKEGRGKERGEKAFGWEKVLWNILGWFIGDVNPWLEAVLSKMEEEEWSGVKGKARCRSWWKIFCWHAVMVLCPILKSNCVQVLWAIIGRECVPCRPDNNHPFFTRSCGTAATKELSTMGNINSLLQKYQHFLVSRQTSLPLLRFNATHKNWSFLDPRYARNCRFILISAAPFGTPSFFRNFVASKERDEGKKNRERMVDDPFPRSREVGKMGRGVC